MYNETDLVNFGNYLLSERRKQLILQHPELEILGGYDNASIQVSDADISNFLLLQEN